MRVTSWDIVRVFIQHARRYAGRTLIVLGAAVIATVFDAIVPWYSRQLIDTLVSHAPSAVASTEAFRVLVIILLLRVGYQLAWRTNGFVTVDFQPRVMADLERTSFAYLLGHSYRFFSDAFSGSLVRKIHRISRAFEVLIDEMQFRFIPVTILLIGATIGLALRYPWAAIVFVVWAAVFIVLNYFASMWKLQIDVQRAAADSASTGALADALTNAIPIKLFTGTAYETDRFSRVKEEWRRLQSWAWGRGEIINVAQGVLMLVIEFGLLAIGIDRWSRGELTVGDFVLIQGYLLLVFNKLWDIGRSFRHVFEAFADAREMVEILELPYAVRDRRGAKTLAVTRGAIVFQNVRFQFQDSRVVLNDFTLRVAPREKVALVGPSGAGKSTVAKLLFRFYDVDTGTITIDGQDIARVSQESLRASIALVPQEPILFHRTLMENIRYGRRDATDAEVVEAATRAHCHEFITECPQGYETYVGERGVKLSGGERQRVAIARAILKDAPILVLDEATSSLDSESEQLIQDALRALMAEKTVIVIAHRLSTIMLMDRIVVVERGSVTATGTHDALLAEGGTYQRLWSIQAGGFMR
ncbi:MAG: ABC transporter ATP-binding protein [bacterium]|nr:ABC transporter ATP-binding protein [bacterium]